MLSFIPSFAEYVHENVDHNYAKEKEELKGVFQTAQLISAAALVAGVAFTIFAFASIASGGLVGLGGLMMLTTSLPLVYFSYNSCRLAANLDNILENPKKYQNLFGLEETFNKRAFKQKISEGTYCFNWFISYLTDKLVKHGMVKN